MRAQSGNTEVTDRFAEVSPRFKARIAGLLYLIVILGGIFAEIFVRGGVTVSGDAAATAHNILAHEQFYRLGFAAELICCLCNVPLTLIFYDLFKVVNRSVSVLVVYFSLLGTAIESVSLIFHFVPLILLGDGSYLGVFTTGQLQSLAYISLNTFEHGFAIALVFFGFFCLSLATLIFKSTFFPRIIGLLLVIEGLLYIINSFANFIAPEIATRIFPFLAASGVAEISLCLWLLVMGVNVQRWNEQARVASAANARL
jgi:hypothetical protein